MVAVAKNSKVELNTIETLVGNNFPKVRLGDVCDFVGGGTPSKANKSYWEGSLPWASVKDVKGTFLTNTQDSISEEGFQNSSASKAMPGDLILVTRISPGKTVLSKIKTAINQDLKVVKPRRDLDSKFLHYYFQSIEKEILEKSSGTTVLGITLNNLNEIKIPLLPIEQQRLVVSKIEELFSELDKGIENLKLAQEQLKVYRQVVLKWAFEGRLTNENVKEGELPEGWKKVKFKDSFDVYVGSTPSRKIQDYWNGDINWVSSGEVKFNNITTTKEKITKLGLENTSCKVHPKGTVILAMIGEGKTRGQTAILNIDASHNQNTAAIRVERSNTNSKLLYYYLVYNYHHTRKGGSGNNQKALNKSIIEEFTFPYPPQAEQIQIVNEIESRISVADKMEESINQSLQQFEVMKQCILKKAFVGTL